MKKINSKQIASLYEFDGEYGYTGVGRANKAFEVSPGDPKTMNVPSGSASDVVTSTSHTASTTMGNTTINNTLNITKTKTKTGTLFEQPNAEGGLAAVGTNWQTIAIVGASAAAIYAIAKLIKGLNQSIKVRYNTCMKTLMKMQKSFSLDDEGLDMKTVLPGVGSKIMDKLANVFTFGKGSISNVVLGLRPFCTKYEKIIDNDFTCALNAFNKVAAVTDTSTGSASVSSSYAEVYPSFKAACAADSINEGLEEGELNEIALATVSAAISLGALAIRGGMFLFSKIGKDGKAEKAKAVQVTKESTREVCYAILNNFGSKYINMSALFKKIGINGGSLADLDKSSCDKLQAVLKKYGEVNDKSVNMQYARVKADYDNMLKRYYAMGDGMIKNFSKFTKDADKDEKHANLLDGAENKLAGTWDAQKPIYEGLFSNVMTEITAYEGYRKYLDFVVEKVMPVFKSGIAGDADYVLDIMPKAGEYYVLRQTQDDPYFNNGNENSGNMALVKITKFDTNAKKISFTLEGLIKSDVTIGEDGWATIADPESIDKEAYAEKDANGEMKPREQKDLEFGKWLALDPHLTEYGKKEDEPEEEVVETDKTSPVYQRTVKVDRDGKEINITDVIFGYGDESEKKEDKEGENVEENKELQITHINHLRYADGNLIKSESINLAQAISLDAFNKMAAAAFTEGHDNDDKYKMGFQVIDNDEEKQKYVSQKIDGEAKSVNGIEEVPPIINAADEPEKKEDEPEKNEPKVSSMYQRQVNIVGGMIEDVIFAAELPEANAGAGSEYDEGKQLNEAEPEDQPKQDANGEEGQTTTEEPKQEPAADEKSDKTYKVIYHRHRNTKDNTVQYVAIALETPINDDEFGKLATDKFYAGHDNDNKYAMGFAVVNDEAAAPVIKEIMENRGSAKQESAANTEAIPPIINTFNVEDKKDGVEKSANELDEFLKVYATAIHQSVMMKPTAKGDPNNWAWVANPDAEKALNAAFAAVRINKDPSSNAFDVPTTKLKCVSTDKKEASFVPAFWNELVEENKDIDPNKDNAPKIPVKLKAIVDQVPATTVEFEKDNWTDEGIYAFLKNSIEVLAKVGISVEIDPNAVIIQQPADNKQEPDDQDQPANQPKSLPAANQPKSLPAANQPKSLPAANQTKQIGGGNNDTLLPAKVNSSCEVTYNIGSSVQESFDNEIFVTRHFSEKYKGYYILSESHVYDATIYDPAKTLSESMKSLIRKSSDKYDVAAYAKAHKNARFGVFESDSTYKVRTNTIPSNYAPLYESIAAFKFDADGNIENVINFGVKVTY